MTINFVKFQKNEPIITGGQKYDQSLYKTLKESQLFDVTEAVVGYNKKLPNILKVIPELIKAIKNCRANILIFNSSSCLRLLGVMLWMKLFTNKQVYTIHHHFIYTSFTNIKKWIFYIAEKSFLKLSDFIIVPSPYIYEGLKSYKNQKNLLLWRIPFNIDKEFDPNPIPGNLTYTGTIEPRKGLEYLLQSVKILKDREINVKVNIIGKIVDETYFRQLKKYIEIHKLNVSLLGFLDYSEKNKILSETDIFVFPSLLEGYGMVLVEAQVYGLPIVCFDNSAMPFTVKNNVNGFTVKTKDTMAFANKIQKITVNRILRKELSLGALKNLEEQWSHNKFKENVIGYFQKIKNNYDSLNH